MIIIIVGIPGCGKTSLLGEVKKQIPSLQIINYGDKLLLEAGLQKKDRDRLRLMPVKEQLENVLKAASKIKEEAKGTTLVDTHALIRAPHGYAPGLPKKVLEILSPRACVIIECAPSLILQRRIQDTKRQRDQETEKELFMHQELSRNFLLGCALETGALFLRIENDAPSIESNALPLIEMIKSLNSDSRLNLK